MLKYLKHIALLTILASAFLETTHTLPTLQVPILLLGTFLFLFFHGLEGYFDSKISIRFKRLSETKTGKPARIWGLIYILFSFVFLALAIYIYWTITHPVTYRTILPK